MLQEDLFHYSARLLRAIAETYEDFEPSSYLPKNWEDIIELKCDFDRAVCHLNKVEQHLVFDIYCDLFKEGKRRQVFRKMARYLNGEESNIYYWRALKKVS